MACEQVFCQSTTNQLPGIKVVENPTGDGGIALNQNFRTIQYRQPKCKYDATRNPKNTDGGGGPRIAMICWMVGFPNCCGTKLNPVNLSVPGPPLSLRTRKPVRPTNGVGVLTARVIGPARPS